MSNSVSQNTHKPLSTILGTVRRPVDPRYDRLLGIDTKYDAGKYTGKDTGKRTPQRTLNIGIQVSQLHDATGSALAGEILIDVETQFETKVTLDGVSNYTDQVFFRWTIAPEPVGPFSMTVTTIGMPFTPSNGEETITVEMPPLFIWPAGGLAYFAVELVKASDLTVIDTESGFNLRRPA
jgi:hypothetical protein